MKILAFVDIHGSMSAIKKLGEKSKSADILVGAGDLSIFENGLVKILNELNKFNKPVLVIHGNHETAAVLKKASSLFENIHFIHEKKFKFKEYVFIGYGGGGFALKDPDFEKFIRRNEREIKKEKEIILVTHAPPYGTKVDRINKGYHGNKSITDFIKKNRIRLLVCGHLHENEGRQDKIGDTLVVNPGPKGVILKV